MAMIPETAQLPDVLAEVCASHGVAYANYRPGAPLEQVEVALVVAGQPVVCSRQAAEDAYVVLAQLFAGGLDGR